MGDTVQQLLEDLDSMVNHAEDQQPAAPLFLVGSSWAAKLALASRWTPWRTSRLRKALHVSHVAHDPAGGALPHGIVHVDALDAPLGVGDRPLRLAPGRRGGEHDVGELAPPQLGEGLAEHGPRRLVITGLTKAEAETAATRR